MVVTRLVGRTNLEWSGKTLFELVTNLKNNGVGRVVYRHSFLTRYPEKSYYRLTAVTPYLSDWRRKQGLAYGNKVFRGKAFENERLIKAGNKSDWRLVPIEEEEEFCRLTEADVRPEMIVPKFAPFPPLLEVLVRQEMINNGETPPEEFLLPLRTAKSDFSNTVTHSDQILSNQL